MIPMLSPGPGPGDSRDRRLYLPRQSDTPPSGSGADRLCSGARQDPFFSILYPQTTLGVTMTDLFIGEVLMTGGEIVDISSYPDDVTDFKQQDL